MSSQLKQKLSETNLAKNGMDREKIKLEQQLGNLKYQLNSRDSEISDIKYKTNEQIETVRSAMEVEKEELKKGYETQIQQLNDEASNYQSQSVSEVDQSEQIKRMEEMAQKNMEKLKKLEADSTNKDKTIAHLSDEVMRQQELNMNKDTQQKTKKQLEKEKFRAIMQGASKKSSKSNAGTPKNEDNLSETSRGSMRKGSFSSRQGVVRRSFVESENSERDAEEQKKLFIDP